jgi:hypothetical protein
MDDQKASIKGHCPKCGADRNALIVGQYQQNWGADEDDISGSWDYRILRCAGCDQVYFQNEVFTSADRFPRISYWPAPSKRKRPDWLHPIWLVDGPLCDLLTSVYVALDNDLRVLAAIGLRTAFDRASELLGIDPDKTFAEKLNQLVQHGHIGLTEKGSLDVLTDAGGAAAHRGWSPDPSQLDTLSSIMEQFVYRTFVLKAEAEKLKTSIPSRRKPSK